MRRFRNPRYAPEALERKLHPSGFSLPVTAEFAFASRSAYVAANDPPPTNPSPNPSPNDPPSPEPAPPPEPDNPWDTPPLPNEPDEPACH